MIILFVILALIFLLIDGVVFSIMGTILNPTVFIVIVICLTVAKIIKGGKSK